MISLLYIGTQMDLRDDDETKQKETHRHILFFDKALLSGNEVISIFFFVLSRKKNWVFPNYGIRTNFFGY